MSKTTPKIYISESPTNITPTSDKPKSPMKRAIEHIKRKLSSDSDRYKQEKEQIEKLLISNTQDLETCKNTLKQAYQDLSNMDIKLFQSKMKYDYLEQTANTFLQENINALFQDLLTEIVEKDNIIYSLKRENEILKKQPSQGMQELDKLLESLQETIKK